MKRWYLLAVAVIGAVALMAVPYEAQALHRGAGDLVCGGCHTMHNSQGGGDLNGTGSVDSTSLILLRGSVSSRAEIHNFCLQCHADDGAQGQPSNTFAPHNQPAPKVLADGMWDQTMGFSDIGAGGDFQPVCGDMSGGVWNCQNDGGVGLVGLGRGHSLGLINVTPPGGDTQIAGFSCTSCHDPHGTDSDSHAYINRYRNLKSAPGDAGAIQPPGGVDLNDDGGKAAGANYTSSWKGSTTGTFAAGGEYVPVYEPLVGNDPMWPVSDGTPTGETDSNIYAAPGAGSDNDTAGSSVGIGRWCAMCHDNWHEANVANNMAGDDWRRHPIDALINDSETSGASVDSIDWNHYNTINTDDFKVPAAQGDGWQANGTYFANADNEDKVFCLSCHFAHGGPYYDNLRWDYLQAVDVSSQTANGVPTNRGCQQCHNR